MLLFSLRLIVLQQIEALTVAFVREAYTQFSKSAPGAAEKLGGKVYPFGSCRLGVQAEGKIYPHYLATGPQTDNCLIIDADLDAICVFPCGISREQFFDGLSSKLEHMKGVQDVLVNQENARLQRY